MFPEWNAALRWQRMVNVQSVGRNTFHYEFVSWLTKRGNAQGKSRRGLPGRSALAIGRETDQPFVTGGAGLVNPPEFVTGNLHNAQTPACGVGRRGL